MIYLTGSTNDADEPSLIAAGVGLMVQPGNSYHRRVARYPFWGADNGCYSDRWTEEPWLAWLDKLPRDGCLFAVAPDVYPDAAATVARSARYFSLIRDLGFPVALVAQDGAEHLDLPWDDFDALFIGGAALPKARAHQEWKVSSGAEAVTRAARAHGKWVHMGRVNGLRRLARARNMGCLSADGTSMKFTRRSRAADGDGDLALRGAPDLIRWHRWLTTNPELPRPTEIPVHPTHRQAVLAADTHPG